MKLFTLSEANEQLLIIRPILLKIKARYDRITSFKQLAQAAAAGAQFGGGGMESGSVYVNLLYELGSLTAEIDALGVQLKDYSRGLIDFPCLKDGRVVLLCWQFGEDDEIRWWHEPEAGFAGRQPL